MKINNYIKFLKEAVRDDEYSYLNDDLENFNKEIIDAYNYFDLQELIPHIKTFLSDQNQFINITPRNDDAFFCGETVYSIKETVFPEIKYFYNDELRELVQKIYREDFKFFNYSF